MPKYVLLCFFCIIIPFLVACSTHNILRMDLYGDDWIHLWDETPVSWLGPYGPSKNIIIFERSLFDLNPTPYYALLLISKVIAAICIYFMVIGITNNSLAGMISSAMFSVIYTGIDTSSWALYMNAFWGISLLSFFVYFFYRSREPKDSLKKRGTLYSISIIFYALSIIMIPVRMHGIFVVILGDLLWVFRNRCWRNVAIAFSRAVPLFLVVYFLRKIGVFHSIGAVEGLFNTGFQVAKDYLKQGDYDFLFYPISIYGNIIFPDQLMIKIWTAINKTAVWDYNYNVWLLLSGTYIFFGLSIQFCGLFSKREKRFIPLIPLSIGAIYTTLLLVACYWTKQDGSKIISHFQYAETSLIGGLFIIGGVYWFIYNRKSEPKMYDAILFSLFWIIAFYFFTYLINPHKLIPSSHRYLTFSGIGFCIFIGCSTTILFKNILKSTKSDSLHLYFKFVPLILILIIVCLNIYQSNSYLKKELKYRGFENTSKVWNSIISHVKELDDFSLFYFTYDDPVLYHEVLIYGFPARMSFLCGIEKQVKWPYWTDNLDVATAIIEKGEFQQPYGGPPQKIDFNHFYSFDIKNFEVTDTRAEVIPRIKNVLSERKKVNN